MFSNRDGHFYGQKTFVFFKITPSKHLSFLHYGEKEICVLFSERRFFMKHKLKICVSKKSPKDGVVTYKKISPEVKVKDFIGDFNKVTIIVPRDSADYGRILTINHFKLITFCKAKIIAQYTYYNDWAIIAANCAKLFTY